MSDNKQNEKNKGVNPVTAGAAGAVIGAGIAVAATAALRDEKTRKKLQKTLMNAKDQAIERFPNLRKHADQIQDSVKDVKKQLKATKKDVAKKAVKANAAATK